MNRCMIILIVALCLFACIDAHASERGRIALFADENHSVSEVWYSQEMTRFDIYVFCLPGDHGMMCAEFSVTYPENVITGSSAGNPALSIVLGNLDAGMSACFSECRNDWVWTHTQTLFLTDDSPATIEIVAHGDAGIYQFANCEPGFPLETVFYTSPLFLNSAFVNDDVPPVMQSAESPDQNHVMVRFDEPLFAETALTEGVFTIFEKNAPGNLIDLIPSSLADGDRTINLVLLDTLVHGTTYTLRAGGMMDCRGNVMPDDLADFQGLDTYPPEYTVCEIDPERWGVTVCFSEPVHPYSASRPGSYWFYEDPYAYVHFGVIEANLRPDGRTVRLVFNMKFKAGQSYRLQVRFVKDLAGNRVGATKAFFKVRDTYPPEIIELRGVACDVLSVRFDEELDTETALDPANYEVLEGGDPAHIVDVIRVMTDVNPDWLYLLLAKSIDPGVEHVLRYTCICDCLGNCIGSGGEPPLTYMFTIDNVGTLLEHYSAEYSNNGIEIRWRLSTPIDEEKLVVTRAEGDNTFFAAIDNPDIHRDGMEYRFFDERIEAGTNYRYRVEHLSDEGGELLFETGAVYTPPVSYSLFQNRPNPFNPTTEIAYSLPEARHVTIEIFDASGRRIKRLVDGPVQAGIHRVVWNGLDEGNMPVASGIYMYRITAGKWSQARKMALIR